MITYASDTLVDRPPDEVFDAVVGELLRLKEVLESGPRASGEQALAAMRSSGTSRP